MRATAYRRSWHAPVTWKNSRALSSCLKAPQISAVFIYPRIIDCQFGTLRRHNADCGDYDTTHNALANGTSQARKIGSDDVTYAKHLKAVLRWAHAGRLLSALPEFPRTKRAKSVKLMKGRPIATEEFERMLVVVPKVLIPEQRKKSKSSASSRPRSREIRKSKNRILEALSARFVVER